ncbi:hypothetical protein BJY52DRAFT_1222944 [Lactarius psammicola]|nr:hypothetical protein BJY52DRAFT_1222944 [Lactarius psammicola]
MCTGSTKIIEEDAAIWVSLMHSSFQDHFRYGGKKPFQPFANKGQYYKYRKALIITEGLVVWSMHDKAGEGSERKVGCPLDLVIITSSLLANDPHLIAADVPKVEPPQDPSLLPDAGLNEDDPLYSEMDKKKEKEDQVEISSDELLDGLGLDKVDMAEIKEALQHIS